MQIAEKVYTKFWNVCQNNKYVKTFLFLSCMWKTFSFLKTSYFALSNLVNTNRYKKILQRKYGGKGSWAVITGGSMGIGKGFAQILAQVGFNICIISNEDQENKIVLNELLQINSSIEVKAIYADFTKAQEPNFFDQIVSQLQHLDISILINNAGIGVQGTILNVADQDIKNIININIVSSVLLTHKLIPILKKRQQSAIINMSSISGDYSFPYFGLYGATKAFLSNFSLSLLNEYGNNPNSNIQVLNFKPYFVTSRLTNYIKGTFIISPYECAESAFQELVDEVSSTNGHWKHKYINASMQFQIRLFGYRNIMNFYALKSKTNRIQQIISDGIKQNQQKI